jgi:replicative DNA helicase
MDDQLYPEASEKFLVAALGAIPGRLERELDTLPGSAFANPSFGNLWAAAAALQQRNVHIDPTTLARELAAQKAWNAGTRDAIATTMLAPRSPGPLDWHVGVVRKYAGRRELLAFAVHAQQVALSGDEDTDASDLLGVIQDDLGKLDKRHHHEDDGPKPWSRLMSEFDEAMNSDVARKATYPTPWANFNEALGGGLRGGRFFVWAGRPGQGKSTAAFNLAGHLAARHVPCLFVSAEMSDLDVTSRVVARGAAVDLGEITRFNLGSHTRQLIAHWRNEHPDLTLWVESRPTTLPAIKTLARRYKRRHQLAVLFVDYLQLIRTGEKRFGSREQEVAHISRELKGLALELDIAVVAPVQLNRSPAGRPDGKPILSDLRESGQIEQDADVVILLHHPMEQIEHGDKTMQEPTGEITFIIAKNRHGACYDVPLDWIPGYATIGPYRPRGVQHAP